MANRSARSAHPRWPVRLGGIALGAAAVLGGAAALAARQARKAERDHPPVGCFLHIAGVRLHYLERGAGPPLLLLHGNGGMVQDFAIGGILEWLAK
jgi:hypothetical protein